MSKGITTNWLLDWLGKNEDELEPGKKILLQGLIQALFFKQANPGNILNFAVFKKRKKIGRVIEVNYQKNLVSIE